MKKGLLLIVALGIAFCTQAQKIKINPKLVESATKVGAAITLSNADILQKTKEYIDWSDANNPIAKNDKYSKRLDKLVAGLENHDGLKLNFKVYKVVDVNAFACADGSIRVFAGLMDIMTDDELLGIIGHEIGHVKNNDIRDAFKNALLTSAFKDAAASQGGVAAALTNSQLGDLGEALSRAQFSQKQERAADDYGYSFLKGAGKNPWGMALGFERLQKLMEEYGAGTESKMDKLFSTHPDTEKRAKRMAEKATKDGFARPENKPTPAEETKTAPKKGAKK